MTQKSNQEDKQKSNQEDKVVPLKSQKEDPANTSPEEKKKPTPRGIWGAEREGLGQRINELKERQASLIGRKQLVQRELDQVENEIRQHTFSMQGGDFVSRVYEEAIKEEKKEE